MRGLIAGLLLAASVHASDDLLARLGNQKATAAQRNDACFALRGDRSSAAVALMGRLLADSTVRTCAARNLREAGAVDALVQALAAEDADARAVAAQELGAMRDSRALEPLGKAARDPNLLGATAAMDALSAYGNARALSLLLQAAGQPNVAGVVALERAASFHDKAVVPVARMMLEKGDVAAKVIALTVIGDLGDAADLPKLRELAATSEPVSSRGRGFGLMPVIDLGQVARNAISGIENRAGSPPSK